MKQQNGINHEELYTTITPAMAEKLLERNTHNRPLRTGVVERYARDMENGMWQKNGMPITIDTNFAIHNGQHRLWAIIESGIPQEMILLTGLDPETILSVDTGANRSFADYKRIESLTETGQPFPYANDLQATLRHMYWYDNHWPALSRGKGGSATFAELNAMLDKYPEVVEAVQLVCSSDKVRRYARRAVVAFVLTHALRHNRDKALRFVEVLRSGRPSYDDDAAWALRERLSAARLTGDLLDLNTETVFVIKAWNYFLADKPLRTMRWMQDEVMPAIVGTPHAGTATSSSGLSERAKKAAKTRRKEAGIKGTTPVGVKRGRKAGSRNKV